jgi:hypothetical protein
MQNQVGAPVVHVFVFLTPGQRENHVIRLFPLLEAVFKPKIIPIPSGDSKGSEDRSNLTRRNGQAEEEREREERERERERIKERE